MNSKIRLIQTYGLWFLDTFCIFLSINISFQMRFRRTIAAGPPLRVDELLLISILFCVVYNFFLDWNHDFFERGYLKEFTAVLKFNLLILTVDLIYVFFRHSAGNISRLVVARFFFINLALSYLLHVVMKYVIRQMMRNELNVRKILVVADKESMEATILRLRASMQMGTQIVGAAYAAEDVGGIGGTVAGDVPLIGGMKKLTEKATTLSFDEVFINAPYTSRKHLRDLIRGFEDMGVTCHYNVEIPDTGAVTSYVGQFGDYSVVTYKKTLYSAKRLLVKRFLDILGGLVGCAVTGLITLVLAPLIKFDSKGPVFFSQIRVGKNGRRFKIYKFRSMYLDAEKRKHELMKENEINGLMFKMKDDPRVTKVGAFIRRTSLDEFPQFLNVLKGDMSLVGTRPPTEEEFEQYNEHYRRRISMTPGLTGLWQVSGRSDITDFDEVVRLDLQYIDNWSLTLDLNIILKTVRVMLTGRGAK